MTITDQIISINNAKHDEIAELHQAQGLLKNLLQSNRKDVNTAEIEDLSQTITQIEFTIKGLEQSIKTLKALQALAFIIKEAD